MRMLKWIPVNTLERYSSDLIIVVCLPVHGKYRVVYALKEWKTHSIHSVYLIHLENPCILIGNDISTLLKL